MDRRRKHGIRVLLYSQDGFGLGHLRRTNAIAGALVRARDDTTVLTVCDSPLGPFFRPGPRQDTVKLPSVVKLGPGVWDPVGLDRPFGEVSRLRQEMLRAVVFGFDPDLILVDHMPHGAHGELLPTLDALREGPRRPVVVLGLRDIVDAPDVVRATWSSEGAYDALEHCYDRVLIYGRPDVFDAVSDYAFPDRVVSRAHYTGYLCTADRPKYPGRVKSRFAARGSETRRLLVATAGGGADAHPVMQAVLDAVPLLRAEAHWSAVLITGPFMPGPLRRALERRGRSMGVHVRASVSDPLSYIEAADVAVARAGYCSSVELLRSGTPTVLVPRPGPSAEQRMRVERFGARGWVTGVDPNALSGERIASAVLDRIHHDGEVAPEPPGLDHTVAQLLAMVGAGEPVTVLPARLMEQHAPAVVSSG